MSRFGSLILIVGLFVQSCGPAVERYIYIPDEDFTKIVPIGKKGLFLTCTRCGCFVDELNSIYRRNPALIEKVLFLSDTNCNKLVFRTTHLSQSSADSISLKFYNAVVFEKISGMVKCRILSVEESPKLESILEQL